MPAARLASFGLASALLLAMWAPPIGHRQSAPIPTPDTSRKQRVLGAARDIMSAARYCTLITIGDDGQPQARIVDPTAADSALGVYIATNPKSRKVREILKDPRVTLLYFDTARSRYVTVIGRAIEVGNSEKAAHHKKEWQPFFPLEDPGAYTLYRIVSTRVELVSVADGLPGDPGTWRPEIVELK